MARRHLAGARRARGLRRGPLYGCLLAALVAAAVPAAAQLPAGPPIELNTSPPCEQRSPVSVALAPSAFVIAWIDAVAPSIGGETTVAARIVGWPGGAGQPLSDPLRLDPETAELRPEAVALAASAEGGFYAAWWGFDLAQDGWSVMMRAFDGTGQPLSAPIEAGAAGGPGITGIALAADAQRRPTLAWRDETGAIYLRLFDSDLTPRGGPVEIAPGTSAAPAYGKPALAIAADGGMLVSWSAPDDDETEPSPPRRVLARRVSAGGDLDGPIFQVDHPASQPYLPEPAVAALESGAFVVIWSSRAGGGADAGVYGRIFDADGSPSGAEFPVNTLPLPVAAAPDVTALDDGGFLAAWSTAVAHQEDGRVYTRVFGPGGTAGGAESAVPPPLSTRLQWEPSVASDAGGRASVAWSDRNAPPIILAPPCTGSASIRAQPLLVGCTPTDSRLCLQGGRFAVEVTVDDPRLGPAFPRPAGAEPLTADTGTFWFFRPANVELMTKVLDGRAVNDRFWFFSGALSNVGHEIVVTDLRTGEERRYENLPGELTSRADTDSFFDPPPPPGAGQADAATLRALAPPVLDVPAPSDPRPAAGATHPVPPCSDPTVLCLQGERIQVRLDWTDPRTGDSGSGFGVPLSDESGWFWFFRPDNAEVVVKVLDGWPVNDFYWVFYGGLTDLELTLSVEDVFAHTGATYHKPPFTLSSFVDTTALPGPFPCPICSAAAPAPSTRSAGGDGTP